LYDVSNMFEKWKDLLRQDVQQAQNITRATKQRVVAMNATLNRLKIEESDLREQILAKKRNLAANKSSLKTMVSKNTEEAQKIKQLKLDLQLVNVVSRAKSALRSLNAKEGQTQLQNFLFRK